MGMHSEFMAFVSDEETAVSVREWAQKQGFPMDSVRIGSPDLFSNLLESDPPPKLAIVDFDGQLQPIQVAARLVSLCGPACHLIAVGSANDVPLYRGMLASGLSDYLVKPLTPELLTQAMLGATRERGADGTAAPKEAKSIVFLGVRGGLGTSTVATNVAWLLAHEMKKKTVLIDLDLQYGTSALALDLEPGHGLRDIVSSPQRVDGLMISGAIVPESDNLAVLSAEETIEDQIHVDPGAIAALLREMRLTYQAVVVDLPRHLAAAQKRLLATAHEIVLVTEMSLVGIRDTLRLRTMIKGLGSTARITQIATRIGPAHPAAVDEAAFAKGAGAKIDFILPDDPKNVSSASNAGKTLGTIAPHAPLTKSLRELAAHLLEQGPVKEKTEKKQANLFGLLFPGSKEKA